LLYLDESYAGFALENNDPQHIVRFVPPLDKELEKRAVAFVRYAELLGFQISQEIPAGTTATSG